MSTTNTHMILEDDKQEYDDDYGYVHLIKAESPLTEQEICSIEYSSKYKESIDFKNIQNTFSTYHQINLLYSQIKNKNARYRSSTILFFKDLDATLTTIGCTDTHIKHLFIQCRQHIILKMIKQINLVKNQYEYLPLMTLLTGPLMPAVDELRSKKYWNKLSDSSFVSKLTYNYETWQHNATKSETEFTNELAGALHIHPKYIQINGVGKGLNDIVIDWTVYKIWIPYYIQGVQTDLIQRVCLMKPQDQIEVKYKRKWIPCTVLEVNDAPNVKGKKVKIRYNKLNGRDRFKTMNTECIWTVKDCDRLRLPDKVYVIVSYNGVKIETVFKPQGLAYCRDRNKDYIDVGHHIFVNRNGVWYRCEVIDAVLEGRKIQVLYLVNSFVKNTEWLRLWEPSDLERISLEDMRV
eukprot:254553_1